MGMFAFRRMKEREAAAQVASTPIEPPKPKTKKKRKPKVSSNGNNDSSDSRSS